jgi:uncharacterized protein YqgC (DUF456 family)
MNNILVTIISGFLILLGTIGSILPFLPGLPLALGGLILFAWYTKALSVWPVVVFAILTLLTIVIDLVAPAMAAKGRKASRQGVVGALLGGFIGIFLMGPLGIILGPFIGAFVGEIMADKNAEHAWQVAFASLFGLVMGSVVKLTVGIGMFIYFIVAVFSIY